MRIIAGEARGRKLFTPRDRSVRPLLDQIRESIFSTLGDEFVGGNVLDLFCGTGSFGLEALSRGARRAVFVDKRPASLALVRKNLRALGFEGRADVVQADALKAAGAGLVGAPFAVALLDPPFGMLADPAEAGAVHECVVTLLKLGIVTPGGVVLLRQPARTNTPRDLQPEAERTYGESTVLWFRSPAPGLP